MNSQRDVGRCVCVCVFPFPETGPISTAGMKAELAAALSPVKASGLPPVHDLSLPFPPLSHSPSSADPSGYQGWELITRGQSGPCPAREMPGVLSLSPGGP